MTTILKPLYGSSVAITPTALQSLGSDATNYLAGVSSAVQDNTANLSIDEQISGILKAGTSPTGGYAEIWAWGILDDTPTYPDTITGSAGAITLTSFNTKTAGAFARLGSLTFDTTSARLYPFSFSLVLNGFGFVPKKWGAWIVQGSGVALASSGNVLTRVPLQYQNV